MKKLLIALVFVLSVGLTTASAQSFRIGVHGGVPVGDVSDTHNFDIGGHVSYMFNPMGVFQFGGMVGYSHYFGDSVDEGGIQFDYPDAQFLPIAATGRASLGDAVFVGLDLGYGIGVNDGNDGGFLWRPKLGFDFMGVGVVGSFENYSMDGGTVSSVNVGVEFGL
ncbi:hypothetical protein [Salinimicrobium soli]|uniref:hypothetical protein n=1 Tax=Salinimicrobium soli TaxID=1254399 RepID=UPI003AAEA250